MSVYDLIDRALEGDINLIVLKAKGVTEKEFEGRRRKFYEVDRVHYVGTEIAYHPNLGFYEGIEHAEKSLREPILVPVDFNDWSDEQKVFYLRFFFDLFPPEVVDMIEPPDEIVVDRGTEEETVERDLDVPKSVIVVVPPEESDDISEEIRMRYEDLEDLVW